VDSKRDQDQQALSITQAAAGEIIIGVIQGINESGMPLVQYPGNPRQEPLAAITTVTIEHRHVGRQVALLFNQGDALAPVVMGLIQNPLDAVLELQPETQAEENKEQQKTTNNRDEVYIDGQKIVFEGREQVVLKCGDASITLTKAGKILIRGKYLLNRSSGLNRIMGGSVQIN
jgi:hypothetical protein